MKVESRDYSKSQTDEDLEPLCFPVVPFPKLTARFYRWAKKVLYVVLLARSLFVFSFLLYQRESDVHTLITVFIHAQSYFDKSVFFCGLVFRKHPVKYTKRILQPRLQYCRSCILSNTYVWKTYVWKGSNCSQVAYCFAQTQNRDQSAVLVINIRTEVHKKRFFLTILFLSAACCSACSSIAYKTHSFFPSNDLEAFLRGCYMGCVLASILCLYGTREALLLI